MELLDLLENRVDSLVAEMESLREENVRLREEASSGLASLTDENTSLKQALEEERRLRDAVLKRVDGLLSRLQSVASATR